MSAELVHRTLVACDACGWVHYVMTPEEKIAHDQSLARYELSTTEREVYESGFRQCLRCESPAQTFRVATEQEVRRALDHIVTPIIVEGALFDL